MRHLKKRSLLVQLIISCCLLFFVAALASITVSNRIHSEQLNESVLDNLSHNLNTINQSLTAQLDTLDQLPQVMLTTTAWSQFSRSRTISNIRNLMTEMRLIKLGNPLIRDILVYCRGDQYLYSPSTSLHLLYFSQHYGVGDTVTFFDELEKTRCNHTLWLNGNNEKFIALYYPPNHMTNASFLFILNIEQLEKQMTAALDSLTSGFVLLQDENGNVITSASLAPILSDKDYLRIISDHFSLPAVNQSIEYQRHSLLLNCLSCSANHWSFVTVTHPSDMLKILSGSNLKWLFTVIGIVLLGLLMNCIVIYINYAPIHKLEERVQDTLPSEAKGHELQRVGLALSMLRQQSDTHTASFQAYLYDSLLRGRIDSIMDFALACQQAGLRVEGDLCYLLLCRDTDEFSGLRRTFLNSPLNVFQNAFFIEKTGFPYHAAVVFFEWHQHEQIKSSLHGMMANRTSTVMSDMMNNMAAMDCETVLCRVLLSIPAVTGCLTQTRKDAELILWNELKETVMLRRALTEGNAKEVKNALTVLERSVSASENPAALLLSLLLALTQHYHTDPHVLFPIHMNHVPLWLQKPDAEECGRLMMIWRDQILCSMESLDQRNTSDMAQAIISYLEDHYTECDFSIEQMADHFGMSAPALSQYFQKKTGSTALDLMISYRMREACRLLETTGLPIAEVALHVGYYHVNSFIRRFKQTYQMTPGEYRRNAAGKKETAAGYGAHKTHAPLPPDRGS